MNNLLSPYPIGNVLEITEYKNEPRNYTGVIISHKHNNIVLRLFQNTRMVNHTVFYKSFKPEYINKYIIDLGK